MDRSRYLSLGGCDPGFGLLAAEDRDFVDRWRQAGGQLEICGGCRVRHAHRSSLGGFIRQYFNYGRGAWRYHWLRREQNQTRLWSDACLHTALPSRLADPLRKLPLRLRPQVLLMVAVWQLANLAGFLWQGGVEMIGATRP
jgi:GT2 family glycosyltransferase